MSAALRVFGRRYKTAGEAPLVLVATRTPAAACWEPLDIASAVSAGECPAVLIQMSDAGRLARIAQLVLLPLARARVERQLTRWGAAGSTGYAVAPSCDAPMWVYRIDSAAATYAHSHLMPRGAWGPLRDVLRWWTGCDPAVAGLLVIAAGNGDGDRYSAPRA
jgi:hypothetical protein